MVRDPLSDLVSRIKNGYMAQAPEVIENWSRVGEEIVNVLTKAGYVDGVERAEKVMVIKMKYKDDKPAITNIVRVSKPGSRTYVGYREMPRVWGGIGVHILSTPKGIMTDRQAKKTKVGGELICKVW
jgi:small subunit ribosomal protein S8